MDLRPYFIKPRTLLLTHNYRVVLLFSYPGSQDAFRVSYSPTSLLICWNSNPKGISKEITLGSYTCQFYTFIWDSLSTEARMTIPQVLTVIDLVYTTISTNQLLTAEKEGILRKHRYTIIPFSSIYCSHSPGSTTVSAKIKKQHLHAYFSAIVQSYEIKLCTPLSTFDEFNSNVMKGSILPAFV